MSIKRKVNYDAVDFYNMRYVFSNKEERLIFILEESQSSIDNCCHYHACPEIYKENFLYPIQ